MSLKSRIAYWKGRASWRIFYSTRYATRAIFDSTRHTARAISDSTKHATRAISDSTRHTARAISDSKGMADRLTPGRRQENNERYQRILENMAVAEDLAPLRASAERIGQRPDARIEDARAAVQGMDETQRRRFVQEQLAADERRAIEAYKSKSGIADDWDVIVTPEKLAVGERELRRRAGVAEEPNARRPAVSRNPGGRWESVPEPGDRYEAPRHRDGRADVPAHTPRRTDARPTLDEWQAVDEVQAQQDLDANHPDAAQGQDAFLAAIRNRQAALAAASRERSAALAAASRERDAALAAASRERDAAYLGPQAEREAALLAVDRERDAALAAADGRRDAALAAADGRWDAALWGPQGERDTTLRTPERQGGAVPPSTDLEAVETQRQTVDPAFDASDSGSGTSEGRNALIAAKIEHAWGSSVGEKGYGAPDEVAERLYDALYNPDHVAQGIQGRLPEGARAPELRESTREALEARVDIGAVPDRAEFVRTVSDTIVRGVPVAQTLLAGAREALAELSRRGVGVMAWSAGEPKHQHHKLADIGIVDPAIAPNVEPPIVVSNDFGPPLEVATAIAPDKTVPENMQTVAQFAGERHLVVADDRTKNVVAFQQHFPDATGLWVQYGAHAAKSVATLERGENPALAEAIAEGRIVPVPGIGELVPTIERLQREGRLPGDENLALASDVDDTLLNNDLRRDLQHAATLNAVQSRGWVAEPASNAPGLDPAAAVQAVPNPWLGLTRASAAQPAGTQAETAPTPALTTAHGQEASALTPGPWQSPATGSAASPGRESSQSVADIVAVSLPPAASLGRGIGVEPSSPPPAPPIAAGRDNDMGQECEPSP